MSGPFPFPFAALTAEVETWIVRALALAPIILTPGLAAATGTWKGEPVTIEARAYRGGPIRFARFVRLAGPNLEIGNLLCLPEATSPLPIFGADLVGLPRATAMLAADLSPTLPPGPDRDRQLEPFAQLRAAHPPLPPGGPLPAWCLDWFSTHAFYTRVTPEQLPAAVAAFWDLPRCFVEAARQTSPRPDLAPEVTRRQDGYAAAHRTDDKGLGLLAKMFGAPWADRFLTEVLFPPLRT